MFNAASATATPVHASITPEREASIRATQAHWAGLAEAADRNAERILAASARGLRNMDSPDVLQNQAKTYRGVVRAYDLELATGEPHCGCCLKPNRVIQHQQRAIG